MKLVYAVDKSGYDDANHIGVRKKVEAVMHLLHNSGISSSLCKYEWISGFPMIQITEDTDVLYFRRIDPSVKLLLKLYSIKKINRKMRIIMEIPTYPFEGESSKHSSVKEKINEKIGLFFLRYFVDRIVLSGQKDKISYLYHIPVIHIRNGVDYDAITARNEYKATDEVNMIAVSGCYFWHGYDRLIRGLKNYYDKDGEKQIVNFHIVGEGDCLQLYKKLAADLDLLDKHVFFYGRLEGKELDEVYDKANLAVDCLACHRKNIYYVSSLKVREYAAKGLPMITSTGIDIEGKEVEQFIHELPADESDIYIEEILGFMKELQLSTNNTIENIRELFRPYCEWKYTFSNVLEYLKEGV